MEVHYISGSTIPSQSANSLQVMKMCEGFARNDCTVTLYCSDTHTNLSNDLIFEFYGITTRFKIKRIRSSPGLGRHLYGFLCAYHAQKSNPDLVFSRMLQASAWSSFFGIPTISEMHTPLSGLTSKLYFRLMLMFTGFRKLICITHSLKDNFIKNHGPILRDKTCVLPDGVNLEQYSGINNYKNKPKNPLNKQLNVGYVGSFHPGKGIELVIKTAELVQQAKITFYILGGNQDEVQDKIAITKELGINNIKWLGYVPNKEVPKHIEMCDVMLLPNQEKVLINGNHDIGMWTSPLKMFEYMAAAKIILASDLPVLREILNNSNSILCTSHSPDIWAYYLLEIQNNRAKYEHLSDQARIDALQFSWDKRADSCLSYIGN